MDQSRFKQYVTRPDARQPQPIRIDNSASIATTRRAPSHTAHQSRLLVLGSCGVIGVLVLVGALVYMHSAPKRPAVGASSATGVVLQQPTFTPVVPSRQQSLATPDGVHSKFDAAKGTYSYSDSIGGQGFIVSEQKLPASYGTGQTAVNKVAGSIKATTPMQTTHGTGYILTNNKYNSQTLVFGVNGLVLFIQSSFILSNTQWTGYINSLQ